MPGQQRGKMKIPAGNANRRRMMCGGETMAKSKKKKTAMKRGGETMVKKKKTAMKRGGKSQKRK